MIPHEPPIKKQNKKQQQQQQHNDKSQIHLHVTSCNNSDVNLLKITYFLMKWSKNISK